MFGCRAPPVFCVELHELADGASRSSAPHPTQKKGAASCHVQGLEGILDESDDEDEAENIQEARLCGLPRP